jgi:2-polyprenyl-3-methyl-5-hydroxy-6-metoxy-1,4-benzoquinol methylase
MIASLLEENLSMSINVNAKQIRASARNFSTNYNSISTRLLIIFRPFICPFPEMLGAVLSEQDVFDIGCGNGFWLYLIYLYRKPRSLAGVDVSSKKLKSATRAFLCLGIRSLFVSAADPSKWPKSSFGVVSMIDVLHHIPPADQESFFRAASGKVSRGGTLIYKDMCIHPTWKALANKLHDLILARQWVHHVDVRKVESWAISAGLTLDYEVDKTTYWYGHEIRCFSRPLL